MSVSEVSKTFSRNILKSKNANRDIAIVFNYLNITKEARSKYSKEKSVIASEREARAWQSKIPLHCGGGLGVGFLYHTEALQKAEISLKIVVELFWFFAKPQYDKSLLFFLS